MVFLLEPLRLFPVLCPSVEITKVLFQLDGHNTLNSRLDQLAAKIGKVILIFDLPNHWPSNFSLISTLIVMLLFGVLTTSVYTN